MGDLSTNFSYSEFKSKDGSGFPVNVLPNLKLLADNLEVLREACTGATITILSGYRSEAHNKKVGGAVMSQHLTGSAADIIVEGFTPKQVAEKVEELIKLGKMKKGGLKAYSSFCHYDVRGTNARW